MPVRRTRIVGFPGRFSSNVPSSFAATMAFLKFG
jgi:hypothetical protein